MINCEQSRKLLNAHHDGELDLVNSVELERHLLKCADCRAALDNLKLLRVKLRESSLAFKAPDSLRQLIGRETKPAARDGESRAGFRETLEMLMKYLTPAAVVVAVILFLQFPASRSHSGSLVENELVSSHIRSLQAAHLMDVVSTDQHTVKPWFEGKLDFAPTVKDLADKGFPLQGGRMDYVEGRNVAALVYARNKHFINLYIWPETSKVREPFLANQERGFNLVKWSDGTMTQWAVSDLNPAELQEFARLIQAK